MFVTWNPQVIAGLIDRQLNAPVEAYFIPFHIHAPGNFFAGRYHGELPVEIKLVGLSWEKPFPAREFLTF